MRFDVIHSISLVKIVNGHSMSLRLTQPVHMQGSRLIITKHLLPQVLSHSVGSILAAYGREEVQETARFILLMDRMFDCLNVRALTEGDHKLKPDLMPYRSVDDPRFEVTLFFLLIFQAIVVLIFQAIVVLM